MDLRRFLVFFVLLLSLFSIFCVSVYSNSVFGVENITHLPPDAQGNDYILGYSKHSGNIFIAVLKTSGNVKSFHITEDGVCDEYGNLLNLVYKSYISDIGEWQTGYEVKKRNEHWYNETLIPYYSNRNVYKNDEILLIGKEHSNNLSVFGDMSYSLIFISLIRPFLKIMPVILIVIVMIFAFCKAWRFLKVVF